MASLIIHGPPRACDRCHSVKAKCQWLDDKPKCERCIRLQFPCESRRPKGKPGRRRGEGWGSTRSRDPPTHQDRLHCARLQAQTRRGAVIPRCIQEFDNVPSVDRQILQLVQRILFQSEMLDLFSVSDKFTEPVRRQVIPQLLLSKSTLLDGLLACAISWAGDVDDSDNFRRLAACYRHASSAIATLMTLEATNPETMVEALMLGALVSSFALKLRVNDVLAICSRTLGLIKPIYNTSDPKEPEPLVFMSCMVMWEVRGCLFSCGLPTLRFRAPDKSYVDRHVGLCASVVPFFYDVCKLSHALSKGPVDATDIYTELEAIEEYVRAWQPEPPEDFTERFDAVEVTHMLCQVQVMRQALLLIAHRLRFPFGVNDGPAQMLSMSILSQLETTSAATRSIVRCVDLALLVACLELKGAERQKWLSDITKFTGFSPQFGEHVRQTLGSFWAGMDSFGILSWSELVKLGSPFLRNQSLI
ncbi:unnamed protein product [Clonostachys byssicola]|uniref:Zn(2)-C6 fungal-type domain-containing protein n=1 Tax=Clonostachys byssicola TaxID=160290 RepID=A0A9N9Y1B2_9HYPO|nr:unnamed protein product [Clonostachys byssicola]